jgi:glutamate racemase
MIMAEQAIGVFDSGVGGLTVLRKLAELMPNENLIYLGDTARVPYGNKSAETICLYAQQCTRFLLERNVKMIVIACNTVSAVALQAVQAISPVPVVGMISPGAAAAARFSNIGIIGTQATVQSKAYEIELRRLNAARNIHIHAQACPLFVPLAEEGWHTHSATELVAREYLAPLQLAHIDCLILGCTHYPLLNTVIQTILPSVQLIDSGEEAAGVAQVLLAKMDKIRLSPNPARNIQGYVTDMNPSFAAVAYRLLGMPFTQLQHIAIDAVAEAQYLLTPRQVKLTSNISHSEFLSKEIL